MSVNQDPDFYKILVGIIAFLFGILDIIGMKILSDLKSTDSKLFDKVDNHESRLSRLEGEHNTRTCK
jgi:hypothetical protein